MQHGASMLKQPVDDDGEHLWHAQGLGGNCKDSASLGQPICKHEVSCRCAVSSFGRVKFERDGKRITFEKRG
jgi:hypothetical protein